MDDKEAKPLEEEAEHWTQFFWEVGDLLNDLAGLVNQHVEKRDLDELGKTAQLLKTLGAQVCIQAERLHNAARQAQGKEPASLAEVHERRVQEDRGGGGNGRGWLRHLDALDRMRREKEEKEGEGEGKAT